MQNHCSAFQKLSFPETLPARSSFSIPFLSNPLTPWKPCLRWETGIFKLFQDVVQSPSQTGCCLNPNGLQCVTSSLWLNLACHGSKFGMCRRCFPQIPIYRPEGEPGAFRTRENSVSFQELTSSPVYKLTTTSPLFPLHFLSKIYYLKKIIKNLDKTDE